MSAYLFAVEARPRHFPGVYGAAIRAVQRLHGSRRYGVVHIGLSNDGDVLEAVQPAVRRIAIDRLVREYALRVVPPRVRLVPATLDAKVMAAWWAWTEAQVGRRYDWEGAVKAGLDWIERLTHWAVGEVNPAATFCSALLAEGAAAVVPASRGRGRARVPFPPRDPAEQTPADVAAWPIWRWRSSVSIL